MELDRTISFQTLFRFHFNSTMFFHTAKQKKLSQTKQKAATLQSHYSFLLNQPEERTGSPCYHDSLFFMNGRKR